MAGSCEYYNKAKASMKGGQFFEQLSDYQLPRRNLVVWSLLIVDEFAKFSVIIFGCQTEERY
jgi:hypothetical protein